MFSGFRFRKFLSVFGLFLFVLLSDASAETLEESCAGSDVQFRGLCECKATGIRFDPRAEPLELLFCTYDTRVREVCEQSARHDGSRATEYLANRCYCRSDRKYLTDPYRESADAAFRVLFHGDKNSETNPDEMKQFLSEGLDGFTADLFEKVKVCSSKADAPIVGAKTVRIVEELPGKAGGKFFKLRPHSVGSPWMDMSDHPGEQGSPALAVFEAGKVIGRFFGLSHNEDEKSSYVTMPDVDELNGAIAAIKKMMPSRLKQSFAQLKTIPVYYYSAPEGAVTARNYIERFSEDGGIPVATRADDGDESYLIHDLAFHSIAFILTPSEMLYLARLQAEYLLKFEKYFWSRVSQDSASSDTAVFKYLFEKLILAQTQRLDAGTSAITFKYIQVAESQVAWPKARDEGNLFFHQLGWGLVGHAPFGLGSANAEIDSVSSFFNVVVHDFAHFAVDENPKSVFLEILSDFVVSKKDDINFHMQYVLPSYQLDGGDMKRRESEFLEYYRERKRFLEEIITSNQGQSIVSEYRKGESHEEL